MIRVLARPLLASWFVYRGVTDVLEPADRAREVDAALKDALEPFGGTERPLPPTDTLVRVHGAATAVTAAMLALSKSPRTTGAALTGLAAITVATTVPFWRMPAGPERDAAMERFMVNLSLLGGAALASTAGHSAGHIKRKKARKAKAKARAAKQKAAKAGGNQVSGGGLFGLLGRGA